MTRSQHVGTAALLAALLALLGCSTGTVKSPDLTVPAAPSQSAAPQKPTPETHSVYGGFGIGPGATLEMPGDDGSECRGWGDFTGISAGDQVTFEDAAGKVVMVTVLEPSFLTDAGDCGWPFRAELPAGGGFYRAVFGEWESKLVDEASVADTTFLIGPGQ